MEEKKIIIEHDPDEGYKLTHKKYQVSDLKIGDIVRLRITKTNYGSIYEIVWINIIDIKEGNIIKLIGKFYEKPSMVKVNIDEEIEFTWEDVQELKR